MDIRNVGKSGGVERGGDRPQRTQAKREESAPAVVRDEARISASSRETAAAVEGLAERARRADGDREAKVTEAMRKLMNGELDGAAVVGETAKRVLDAKFLSS